MSGGIYRTHSNSVSRARFQVDSRDAATARLAKSEEYLSLRDGFCGDHEVRSNRSVGIRVSETYKISQIVCIGAVILRCGETSSDENIFGTLA